LKIVSKCPLRISLVGGSTDSPSFIKKYGRGSVISFTPNLFTYTSVFRDVNGFNNFDKKYILSYARNEEVSDINQINNELIREALLSFPPPPCKIILESDIFSSGSGLAVSSSYTVGIVNSLKKFSKLDVQISEICKEAFSIEKKNNPYNGYQDTYGVAFGGLKRLDFYPDETFTIKYLDPWIFDKFDFYLIYTGIKRESSSILKTIDIDKSYPLLDEVDSFTDAIVSCNETSFIEGVKRSWEIKKKTSTSILKNPKLKTLTGLLESHGEILTYKLCGAGGGGYFLAITPKKAKFNFEDSYPWIKISLETEGLSTFIV